VLMRLIGMSTDATPPITPPLPPAVDTSALPDDPPSSSR
jgi:hypothetical protein